MSSASNISNKFLFPSEHGGTITVIAQREIYIHSKAGPCVMALLVSYYYGMHLFYVSTGA